MSLRLDQSGRCLRWVKCSDNVTWRLPKCVDKIRLPADAPYLGTHISGRLDQIRKVMPALTACGSGWDRGPGGRGYPDVQLVLACQVRFLDFAVSHGGFVNRLGFSLAPELVKSVTP